MFLLMLACHAPPDSELRRAAASARAAPDSGTPDTATVPPSDSGEATFYADGDCPWGAPHDVYSAEGGYDPSRPACLAAEPLSEACASFAAPGASGPCPTFTEWVERSGWLVDPSSWDSARRCVTNDGAWDVFDEAEASTWFAASGEMVAREERAPWVDECGGHAYCFACAGIESMNAWWGTPIDGRCDPDLTVPYTRADFGVPAAEGACHDGLDADLDRAVDCADPDCAGDSGCGRSLYDGVVPPALPARIEGSTFGRPDSHAPQGWDHCPGRGGSDRAFVFVAPNDGTYRFDTVGSSFDTYLYVRTASGDQLGCNDWFELDYVNSLCVNTRPESMLELELAAGAALLVVVDGADEGASGDFILHADGPSAEPRTSLAESPPDREGCGCASGDATGWTWFAIALPLGTRRSRRGRPRRM